MDPIVELFCNWRMAAMVCRWLDCWVCNFTTFHAFFSSVFSKPFINKLAGVLWLSFFVIRYNIRYYHNLLFATFKVQNLFIHDVLKGGHECYTNLALCLLHRELVIRCLNTCLTRRWLLIKGGLMGLDLSKDGNL